MSKLIFSFTLLMVLSVFILMPCAFPQEDITITTYYPSPLGVYKDLRSKNLAIGDNYMDNSQYCWEGSCTNLIDAATDLIVEGNVGIGTANPQGSQDGRLIGLDVDENIAVKDVYLDNPKSGSPRWASEGGESAHTNCVWFESPYCGARPGHGWIDVTCPEGKFVAGIGLIGCTGSGATGAYCDDSARCEKTRVYCCGQ